MSLAEKQTESSWSANNSPLILSEIFSSHTSVAVWERHFNSKINRYFQRAFQSLGMGIRGVFSMNSLKDEINEKLPNFEGKQDAVNDIYLLSDMLTCLFDCDNVGLRLAPLKSAMCPRFHYDNIPVRLVNTYVGMGTQWLPVEAVQAPSHNSKGDVSKINAGVYYDKNHIQQMNTFDVGLLKGKAWPQQEQMAALHRSCQLSKDEKRVLLTLDPM